MPEYDFSDGKVKVTVTGKILDLEFARVLARNPDLTLEQIIILDKVQKKKPISEEEIKYLREMGLIEGRKPNIFISSNVLAETSSDDLKAQYIRHRAFNDDHYKKLILEYIHKYGSASRREIEALLLEKLPEILNDEQKLNKISNLISALRIEGKIKNTGSAKKPNWIISP